MVDSATSEALIAAHIRLVAQNYTFGLNCASVASATSLAPNFDALT
jgi:hypothetical protein